MAAKIFRINYKSDFILTLNSDAGWMTPFCIKFWTGVPSQAFFVGWDGETYTHCAYDPGEPTKLLVQFDDHHLPIGELKYQVAYHFTVADFPNDTEDEVLNQANITTEIDGETYQVMLDFTGETAPEIAFSLPAYANEAQRIANEEQRIAHEAIRIVNEESRIAAETIRQQNEAQRIAQETARVNEFATLKSQSQAATREANDAATLANQKAQLAADKAALADDAATLANAKAQLAADKAALANAAAQLANEKAALAQQKAEYAQTQGGYAKDQGDYAKDQGDYAKAQSDTALADHQRAEADHGIAVDDHTQTGNDHTRAESDHGIAADDHTQAGNDHTRAESDHGIAADDHTQAGNDHTRAESDHGIAADDHTQAGNDHTRAESDHTRAESDHAAVEMYVDSLGVFDLSKHNAVGGVLATYSDLSAALTALNALDSKYKYGGMSFKFVQSSDNKYVQARCIADEFTTDVTQWQSVDTEPINGSKNLIESNAVYKVKELLEDNLNTDGYEEFDIVSYKTNLAPTKNGYVSAGSDYRTRYIKLYKGYTYIVNASVSSRFAISNDEPAVGVAVSEYVSDGNTFTYTASDDCYVGLGNSNATGTYKVKKIISNSLAIEVNKRLEPSTGSGLKPTLSSAKTSELEYDLHDKNTSEVLFNNTVNISSYDLSTIGTISELKKGTYLLQVEFSSSMKNDETVLLNNSGTSVARKVFDKDDGRIQAYQFNLEQDYDTSTNVMISGDNRGLSVLITIMTYENLPQQIADVNNELSKKIVYTEGLSKDYKQTITVSPTIIIPNVMVGKTIYYKFTAPANTVAAIRFINGEGTAIGDIIGNPSSSHSTAELYEGTVQVPENAAYLRAGTSGNGFTIEHLYYTDSNIAEINETKERVDVLEQETNELIDLSNTDKEIYAYETENNKYITVSGGSKYVATLEGNRYYLINVQGLSKVRVLTSIVDSTHKSAAIFFNASNAQVGSGYRKEYGDETISDPIDVPSGAVYMAVNGKSTFDIHAYSVEVADADIDLPRIDKNSKKYAPYMSLVPTNGIAYNLNKVLFTIDNVNVGDEVFFSVRNYTASSAGYIVLLDSSYTAIKSYGITAGGSLKTVTGSFIIPSNFAKAIVRGTNPLIINYLRFRVQDDPTNLEIDFIDNRLWKNDCWLENRLANPIFTSISKYNEENPNDQIVDETAMSRSEGINELRIPISAVTNNGSVLVAATASASGPVEYGETSIDVARKASGSDTWVKTRVFDYEEYGQFFNLSFVIDRLGVIKETGEETGHAGRIYLFSSCVNDSSGTVVPGSEITYDEADLLYTYSDDDGVSWATPISLKQTLYDSGEWTPERYTKIGPAPNNGIQLTDGTLVIPMFNAIGVAPNRVGCAGIMYKKLNGSWKLSPAVPSNVYCNECIAVECETNVPTLFTRNENENSVTVNDADYIQDIGTQIFRYSFTNDSWTKIDSTFIQGTPCQFSIIKCSLNGTTLYLKSALDCNSRPERKNPTIWASLDCMTWIRVYRMYNGGLNGYTSLAEYDGKLVVSYETNGNYIKFQDITKITSLILNSVNSYINYNITIQDRMQMLFNMLNGID